MRFTSRRQRRRDPLAESVRGRGTDVASDLAAVPHTDERRNALDAEPGRGRGRLVDVDLDHLATADELGGELLEDRAHDPARPTPWRPQVHNDGDVAVVDDVGKGRVVRSGAP